MRNNAKSNLSFILMTFIITILLMVILVAAPSLDSGIKGFAIEDTGYSYNFTQNVSGTYVAPLVFSIEGINSSEHSFGSVAEYSWISINSSTGIMNINASANNQTGDFNISIRVLDSGSPPEGQTVLSNFRVNATNDAPNFTNIFTEYNLTQDTNFLQYINAIDEEEHYPLHFNVTWFGNCTHAAWSGRSEGENCSIINYTHSSNTSMLFNFTPGYNDVGVYWANITVMDFGNSSDYGCPHEYCTPETYNINQTTLYSNVVRFDIRAVLFVNTSDCQNKIFQENQSGACQINITTPGASDGLNISSSASMRWYSGGIFNTSWFYSNTSTSATNFRKSININITPQKTEVGNWSINFSVSDSTTGEFVSYEIYVYVNKSDALEDIPNLVSIDNVNTSVDLPTTISLTAFDDDFLIPHKNTSSGGYNETLIFNLTILNASDLSQELNLTDFEIDIISMPVLSSNVPTNKTTAQIQFTPNLSDAGNYTINITISDLAGNEDSEEFNLFIFANSFPYWNSTLETIYSIIEEGNFYLNLSNYSIDPDEDTLTYSNWTSTYFPAFFLNTTSGEINVSGIDDDSVGQHIVNITVSDGYLTNTTVFNFTINNTNEIPFIRDIADTQTAISGITVNTTSGNMNTTEDLSVQFRIFINDTDFNIRQKEFYNESLLIDLTIEGVNTSLFSLDFQQFTELDSGTNYSRYAAIFTPRKADVGTYTISINVSDSQNASDFVSFNLTVAGIQHNPNMTTKDDLISSIEESILIDFNATDLEDGNDYDNSSLFRFNVTFLTGNDFINGDETIFNTTSGFLNITFNASLAGAYSLNISVNDTTGRQDSIVWNLTVYDYPVFLSPATSFNFSMAENTTYEMNFSVNHTIQNNLSYSLYINGVLRNETTGYGNAAEFLWDFTSNFSDESTCLGSIQLSVNVSNAKLSNYTSWNLEINHTNYPLKFNGEFEDENSLNIGGSSALVTGGSSATISLDDYFTDLDATDTCYNQTIGFTATFLNGSALTHNITNWSGGADPVLLFTHPSSGTLMGNYSLIAKEYNISDSTQSLRTIDANNFSVQLSVSTSVITVPTSSGGGGGVRKSTEPISLKIIVPDPVSSRRKDRLVLPISLMNTGKVELNNIFLKAGVAKDGLAREDLLASFDKSIIDKLAVGAEEDLTLIVDANTEEYGLYELTINATVGDPVYNDWAKIFINVEETEDILERILFTEEFVVGNPECVELTELIEEARGFLNTGAIDESYKKLNEALEACRIAIEQPPYVRIANQFEKYLFNYVWIVSLIVFMAGFLYYSYRRRKLKKGLNEVKEQSANFPKEKFNNKKKLI